MYKNFLRTSVLIGVFATIQTSSTLCYAPVGPMEERAIGRATNARTRFLYHAFVSPSPKTNRSGMLL